MSPLRLSYKQLYSLLQRAEITSITMMLGISHAACGAASTLNIGASRAGSGIPPTAMKGRVLLEV